MKKARVFAATGRERPRMGALPRFVEGLYELDAPVGASSPCMIFDMN